LPSISTAITEINSNTNTGLSLISQRIEMSKDKILREAIATDRQQMENEFEDVFKDRVSLNELRKIWNDRNHQYTDEELCQIRDWLYVMAGAVLHTIENNTPEVLKNIRNTKTRKRINRNALVFIHKDKPTS